MSRPEKNQLLNLAEGLSPRRRLILEAVAAHRFLTGGQLHRLLFGGVSERTSRRDFRHMVDDQLLFALERRIGGVRSGSKGYVYGLGPTGTRLADYLAGEGLPASSSRREPSRQFLAHTLAVSELYVRLVEADREHLLELVGFESEPACWRTYVGRVGQTRTLKPDCRLSIGRGEFEEFWWVEVDRGTVGRSALKKKHLDYLAYQQTGQEQQIEGVFPRVLWVVPDTARARVVGDLIKSLGDRASRLFSVTTEAEAVPRLIASGEPRL